MAQKNQMLPSGFHSFVVTWLGLENKTQLFDIQKVKINILNVYTVLRTYLKFYIKWTYLLVFFIN